MEGMEEPLAYVPQKGDLLYHAIYGAVAYVEPASVPSFARVRLISREGPHGVKTLAVGWRALSRNPFKTRAERQRELRHK